jgi:hypothetical protein
LKGCGGKAARLGLLIVALIVVMVVVSQFQDWLWDIASHQCPPDTFASGKVHFSWDTSASALFGASLLFLFSSITGIRIFPPEEDTAPAKAWRILDTTIPLAMTIVAGAGLWFTTFTPVCLAESGIYHRTAPQRAFQRHQWTDVVKVDVDCRNRRRSPDLYYVLTMKDHTELDVADALRWRAFASFRTNLAGVPLKFTANIADSCPSWFSDWVGTKP